MAKIITVNSKIFISIKPLCPTGRKSILKPAPYVIIRAGSHLNTAQLFKSVRPNGPHKPDTQSQSKTQSRMRANHKRPRPRRPAANTAATNILAITQQIISNTREACADRVFYSTASPLWRAVCPAPARTIAHIPAACTKNPAYMRTNNSGHS